MATYDPLKVLLTIGVNRITGFASGTFIEVERNADAVNLLVGTQGEYAWAIGRDRSGIITLTLMHTAFSNDFLEVMARADELGGLGGRSALIEDLNGRTLIRAPEVHVLKRPTISYGAEVMTREWQVVAGAIDVRVGGNFT